MLQNLPMRGVRKGPALVQGGHVEEVMDHSRLRVFPRREEVPQAPRDGVEVRHEALGHRHDELPIRVDQQGSQPKASAVVLELANQG